MNRLIISLLFFLLPTLAIAQTVGELEPWLENDFSPKLVATLVVDDNDFTGMGDITGDDVNISAGTGNYTSTGYGVFAASLVKLDAQSGSTAMVHSTSGNLYFGAFGTESTLVQSNGQLKFFGANMVVPAQLRRAAYENSKIVFGEGGADTNFENAESGGFVFRTNAALAAANTDLVSIDGSGNINILLDNAQLTLGAAGATDSYLEWNTAGATDHLLIYSLGGIQLGTAATEIHGINTAPVANQMLTADFTNGSGSPFFIDGTMAATADDGKDAKGYSISLTMTGLADAAVAADGTGVYSLVTNNTTYNAGGVTGNTYGIYAQATFGGTVTATGATETYGGRFVADGDMGTAAAVIRNYGCRAAASGTATTNYGGHFSATSATINWAIFNAAGNVFLGDDNEKTMWGTTNTDLQIYSDGDQGVFDLTGALYIRPSGDTDDYFSFSTASDVPTIGTVGSCDLILAPSGGVQIGDAATEIHGINTAPVANQMLTADFTDAGATSFFIDGTYANTGADSKTVRGYSIVLDISGTHDSSGIADSRGVFSQINDNTVYNSSIVLGNIYGVFGQTVFAGTNTDNGGLKHYGGFFKSSGDMGTNGASKHYGILGLAADTADVNYGGFFSASGATNNWAVYASAGNVYVADDLIANGQTGNTLQTPTLGVGVTTLAITKNVVTLTGHVDDNTLGTITGGLAGQTITIICTDAKVTITDTNAHTANTVDLSAAFTSADDTVLSLIYDGTSWYEVSRSVN